MAQQWQPSPWNRLQGWSLVQPTCNRPYSPTFCPLPPVSNVHTTCKPGSETVKWYPSTEWKRAGIWLGTQQYPPRPTSHSFRCCKSSQNINSAIFGPKSTRFHHLGRSDRAKESSLAWHTGNGASRAGEIPRDWARSARKKS